MRILILNHEYPPVGGGGGQACKDIAVGLAKRGHELTVITALIKGFPRDEMDGKIRIIRVPSNRKYPFQVGFFSMAMYILAAIWKGMGVIRQWKPDVIHVHFAVPAGVAAEVLKFLSGVPYVLTSHLGDVPGGVPDKTDKWFRWVYPFTRGVWKNAKQVVAVSQFTGSLIRKEYGIEPLIIPNGIDLSKMAKGKLTSHRPPRVIFVGRFTKQKNLLELVEVLDAVRDIPWQCTLIGDGPQHEQIIGKIREYRLDNRFELPGWVEPENVDQQLEESDLLFMPSRSEGLSVVGIHGLTKGLAIVAYKVGGFEEMVEQGLNGSLAEPGDRDTLIKAMRSFLGDEKKLSAARQASLKFALKFDMDQIVAKYDSLLQQAKK